MEVFFPGGTPIEDLDKENAPKRIGDRLRKIRKEQGLSQGELGEKVGLSANRVQQYENGARKPKLELCKQFADALEVETNALLDPQVENYIGAMYALFSMEEKMELRLKKVDGQICLCFGDSALDGKATTMNRYLKKWYEMREQMAEDMQTAMSDEQRSDILHEYHMWQWNFPFSNDKEVLSRSEREAKMKAWKEFERLYSDGDWAKDNIMKKSARRGSRPIIPPDDED